MNLGKGIASQMERIDRSAMLSREGLPGRYAAALFDLAAEQKRLDETAKALAIVRKALADSDELAALVHAPQIARKDAADAIMAVAGAIGLPKLTADFLGVVAANGRLSALPSILSAFDRLMAAHEGTSTAHITAAHTLSAAQKKALAAKLKARTGRTMDLDVQVDPTILGGLVVRIGSEQIDGSVRTRLDRLGQQMKGL